MSLKHLNISYLLLLLLVGGVTAQELSTYSASRLFNKRQGEKVYRNACAACHGYNGDGQGPAARYLKPKPRNFLTSIFKFRSTATGKLPLDEDLIRTVRKGIPRTMMPAWEELLSDTEILDVVTYLKTFSGKFASSKPSTSITIPEELPVTPESIAEGKSLFMIMDCWTCHGARGTGDGPSSKTLVDKWGDKIKPIDFTTGNYKAGNSNRDVYKTFNTGLDGTPMPSFADVFDFGRESLDNFEIYKAVYSPDEIEMLRLYLNRQPNSDQIEDMTPQELQRLLIKRKWSIVHYVRSLEKPPSLLKQIFSSRTDLTKQKSKRHE